MKKICKIKIVALTFLVTLGLFSYPAPTKAALGDVVIKSYSSMTVPLNKIFRTTNSTLNVAGKNDTPGWTDQTPSMYFSNPQLVKGSDNHYYFTLDYWEMQNKYYNEWDYGGYLDRCAQALTNLTYTLNINTSSIQKSVSSTYSSSSDGISNGNPNPNRWFNERIDLGTTQPSTITISLTESGNVDYVYNGQHLNLAVASSAASSNVSPTVTMPATPGVPSSLSVSGTTATSTILNWSSSANATTYNVYNGSTLFMSGIAGTTYTASGLTTGARYDFSVTASNGSSESAHSNTVTVYPSSITAPTGVTASNVTSSSAQINWSAVSGAATYNVYDGASKINASPVTGTSYVINGLAASSSHSIQVTAIDSYGVESAKSSPATFTTLISAPSGVTVSNVTTTSASITWPSTSGASSYNLYDGAAKINSSPIGGTSYSMTGLASGTSHSVTVTAVDSSGNESAKSSPANFTTLISAPSGVTASSVTTTSASITWGNTSGASSYNLYDGATKINSSPINGTSYSITGLAPGSSHSVTVTAVDSGGNETAKSSPTNFTTLIGAPSGVTVSNVTTTSALITWPSTTGASSYNLYDGATKINSSPISGTSYSITGLAPGSSHSVAITAIDSGGNESAKSSPANFTTLLTAPVGVSVTNITDNAADVSWSSVSGANSYNLYDGETKLNSTTTTGTSYTMTGLAAGSSHTITVTAVDSSGMESAKSNPIDFTTTTTSSTTTGTAPVVLLKINNGEAKVTNTAVTLHVTAASANYGSNELQMSFSADGMSWSALEHYSSTKAWTLANTGGEQAVFVRVIDPDGNSNIAAATVYYIDVSGTPIVGDGGDIGGGSYPVISYDGHSVVYVTKDHPVTLDLTSFSGAFASVSVDNISWSSLFDTTTSHSIMLPAGDGLKTVYVRLAAVNDENSLGPEGYVYFLVDSTSPELAVKGASGATATSGSSFMVDVDASDDIATTSQLEYQVDNGSWQPLPANEQISIPVTPHSGPQSNTISVRDLAGNIVSKKISYWSL